MKKLRIKIKKLLFKYFIERKIFKIIESKLFNLNTKKERQDICKNIKKCFNKYFFKVEIIDKTTPELIDKNGIEIDVHNKKHNIHYIISVDGKHI